MWEYGRYRDRDQTVFDTGNTNTEVAGADGRYIQVGVGELTTSALGFIKFLRPNQREPAEKVVGFIPEDATGF